MGVARVASRAQLGLSAPRVEVEVHLGGGLPAFSIVGLPATAVKESKDRVRAALAELRLRMARRAGSPSISRPRICPRKVAATTCPSRSASCWRRRSSKCPRVALRDCEFYGELGLAGELKPIKGVLLAAAHAARDGRASSCRWRIVGEARIAAPRPHAARHSLLGVCASVRQPRGAADATADIAGASLAPPAHARWISPTCAARPRPSAHCIVAAAGGHSLLLVGPPGTGKSMLAQRLPGLLPALEGDEALDVASIASVSTRGFDAARIRPPAVSLAAPHRLRRRDHRRRSACTARRSEPRASRRAVPR